MAGTHKWTFFRAGGFDQVKLTTGADLRNLDQLDQKLWVALACPTRGLEIESRTLELIDTDGNGRVRAPELIAAARYATDNLKRPDDLFKGEDGLPLEAINDSTPEGRTLASSARQILRNIGKADAAAVTVADVSDKTRLFAGTPFNGDGVITELSAPDESGKAIVREIMDCVGSVPDLSGQPGIGKDQIEAFFAEARAYAAWLAEAETGPGTAKVFPLGKDATIAAVAAMEAVRAKCDDYFARCRLAAYDPRAEQALNRREEEYLDFAAKDLTLTASEVAGFPLAHVTAGRPLPLTGPVNPAHVDALKRFAEATVAPAIGARKELSEGDWLSLQDRFAPYKEWDAGKAGRKVEKLGEARIRALLASGAQATVESLLAQDENLKAETAGIEQVERLARYYRDLALLCINFVSFKDFYDGQDPAIFQVGTLFLDQRACRLCLRVEDPAKHALMAGLAGAYLAYCDCVRSVTGEKMQIVAAFTAGDGDNLMVGRNGLFYDRKGQDWDATIVKIVDNPISIRQAFWSPYKKFLRYLEEQVNKRAAAADAEAHAKLATAAVVAVNPDATKPPPPPPPEPKKMDVGTVAAIGVAAGAIGTFATALVGHALGIFQMGILATLGALIGLMLLISLPSVVMAYMKLRKRNLGPILDSNGWAVNSKAKINVPFGATLSSIAKLPPGARRDFSDPYAEKAFPWKLVATVLLLIYCAFHWYVGGFDTVLPGMARSTAVLGKWAPKQTSVPNGATPGAAASSPTPAPPPPPAVPTPAPAPAAP
ncbi:MAG: hypothetical protein JF616_08025 [Fibrobacteres bacterium]|nr:hypothetical protein [Fibrobacterota bacterium]